MRQAIRNKELGIRLFVALTAAGLTLAAHAGPGAHGPGGEHLDGPAPVLSAGNTVPRVEAKSETFELVARIEGGALSILIDRYDTNEPVLDAAVEVESGSLKAKAAFRRDQGDYTVSDPQLIKALSTPGAHAMVFTVSAGKDSDLLDGSMQVADPVGNGGAGMTRTSIIAAAVGGAIVAIAAIVLLRRRQRRLLR